MTEPIGELVAGPDGFLQHRITPLELEQAMHRLEQAKAAPSEPFEPGYVCAGCNRWFPRGFSHTAQCTARMVGFRG